MIITVQSETSSQHRDIRAMEAQLSLTGILGLTSVFCLLHQKDYFQTWKIFSSMKPPLTPQHSTDNPYFHLMGIPGEAQTRRFYFDEVSVDSWHSNTSWFSNLCITNRSSLEMRLVTVHISSENGLRPALPARWR